MRRDYIKPILIGAGLAFTLACFLSGLALMFKGGLLPVLPFPTAIINKIAVSTATIMVNTTNNYGEPISTDNTGISNGSFVQITGTGGVGLRIRLAPGKESPPQFVAMENEVFQVINGPVIMDEITWWFLVATYDKNRQGWAAGLYLTVINFP